jgi:hypothetical protein
MAKPGSSAAAAIAGGVDLGAVKAAQASIPPEKAADVQRKAELSKKMRCAGCGERIGTGFRFHKFTAIRDPDSGQVIAGHAIVAACNGHGAGGTCDFAEHARRAAQVVEVVEFAWLDEPPEELLASLAPAPEYSASRLCGECGQSFSHPLADEEKWTGEPGHAWVCPACSGALASAPAEE